MTKDTTIEPLMTTDLDLPGKRRGKVRDIYEAHTTAGEPVLLIIASDRISAFDVVMPNGIPGKGVVLTQVSRFWFDRVAQHFGDSLHHHLLSTDLTDIDGVDPDQAQMLAGRVMVGRRCSVVPIECVVRGFLAGSGWKEYQRDGTVCGVALPSGLTQCQKLPEPIFTPSTKAETGHDENISFEQACEIAGESLMAKLQELSLRIYQMGYDHAADRGILLADAKFEFGIPVDGSDEPILIDEVLTPDSSRFWPADRYESGRDQPSFDKQYVRNYLQGLVDAGRWDKTPPGPELPVKIVHNTLTKYLESYRCLTGEELAL